MEHRESLRFSAVLLPYCCRMAAAWLQFGPEVGYFAATPCLLSRVSKVQILHGSWAEGPENGPGCVFDPCRWPCYGVPPRERDAL